MTNEKRMANEEQRSLDLGLGAGDPRTGWEWQILASIVEKKKKRARDVLDTVKRF